MRTFDLSAKLHQRARRVIPGASQTNSKRVPASLVGRYPVFLVRGSGAHVWDVDGNEYIDYIMALGPIVLGYRYPAVERAIAERLREGLLFGLPHPLEVEAAEALVEAVPCAEMVRFLKSGAEATSAAARIARAFTGREVILSHGYHGWHDNWTALRNDGGVPRCLEERVFSFPYNDLAALERLFAQHEGQVAAVIMIPTQVEKPQEGYLQGVKELCHRHGALLIFDEIVTGFRMALGGAQEFFGVVPDLAAFAKGMANGMPLAAVVGKREVMALAENLLITTTYGGEILSLAALVASLEEYRQKPVHTYLWEQGQRLVEGLEAAAREHGIPFRCLGYPLMAQPDLQGETPQQTERLWDILLTGLAQRGVLIRRGGLMFITYSHTPQDIERTVEAFEAVFREMKSGV